MGLVTGHFRLFLLLVCLSVAGAAGALETLTVQPGQRLELTHDDPTVKLEVAVDGGVLEALEQGFAAPEQGDHWIALAARDEVGHRSELRWVLLRVAAPPTAVDFRFVPAGAANDEGGHWVTAAAAATVRIDGSRPPYDAIQLRLGERVYAEDAGLFRAPSMGAMDQTLVLEGVDRNGESHAIRSLLLLIDDHPPELRLQVSEGSVVDGEAVIVGMLPARLSVQATDQGSGMESVQWSADGHSWSAVSSGLEVGEGPVHLRALDRAGNQVDRTVRVELDAEAPVIKVSSPRTGSAVSGGGRLWLHHGDVVKIAAVDAGSGIDRARYRVGAGPWMEVPATIPIGLEGVDSLEVEAWDMAGNHCLDHYKVRVRTAGEGAES